MSRCDCICAECAETCGETEEPICAELEEECTHMDIFVFGSNLAGRHGKGAALTARKSYGAIYGQGWGRQGHSYAIPTKNEWLQTLPLERIKSYVDVFISYAKAKPELAFIVTRIGCGLAGYKDKDIAPMFKDAPENCTLPDGWRNYEHREI